MLIGAPNGAIPELAGRERQGSQLNGSDVSQFKPDVDHRRAGLFLIQHVCFPPAKVARIAGLPGQTLRDWLFMMRTALLPHDDGREVSSQCRLKAGPLLEHQFPKLFDPQLV